MLHYLQNLFQALDLAALTDALVRMAAVFLCLTVHEVCHGLAAYALGDPTAKSMHRLSLNPLRHIDWFGLVMMFAAGFGWAKPVPVDPRYFKKPKQGMALTALAGPVSNLLLAVLLIAVSETIYLYAPYNMLWSRLFTFCLYTAAPLSVGLGLFNLLPIPPLDGYHIFNDILLKGRLNLNRNAFQIAQVVLIVLCLSGGLSSILNTAFDAVEGSVLRLLLRITGAY